jgi:hypothetical protein
VGGNRLIRGGKVRYASGSANPPVRLASYAVPVLQLGEPSGRVTEFFGGMNDTPPPQSESSVNVVRAAGAVDVVHAAGAVDVVHAAGAVNVVPAAGAVNVVPAAGAVNVVRAAGDVGTPQVSPQPGIRTEQSTMKPGDQPAPGAQQGGVQIDAQTAQALAGLGSTLLTGTRDIVVTAITQGAETDRERARQQANREIANLQRQGLLSQQEANNAVANVDRALAAGSAPATPPAHPPQGFFASMSTGQKVALGVGGAAVLAALGYGIYRATRD